MTLADHVDLVVLDFDGTVCDSVGVKNDAFRLLYLEERGEDFAAAVLDYHLANLGVSRYDKIRHVETAMLGNPDPDAEVDRMAERFGRLVYEGVVAAPLLDGAAAFLAAHAGDVALCLASATPTEELARIVAAKGLAHRFAAIEGSPTPKAEIVAGFVARFARSPDRAVMVGDQPADREAARAAGIGFVGVRPVGDERIFPAEVPVVADLTGLESAVVAAAGTYPAAAGASSQPRGGEPPPPSTEPT